MSDLEQLVRASRLYYELGETQNAIAEQLGVTRPQVSRLLKRARAEGIVEIRIVDRTSVESPAGDALRRTFGLDAVHLAPTIAGPEDLTRRMVGRLAAEVLRGDAPDRRGRRCRRRGVGGGDRRGPRGDRHARSRSTVVPAVRRLLDDRPGARAVPARRRRARRPGARADGARSRRRRRHATGARRARRASARSSTSGSGSTSRCSGSAARPGASQRSGDATEHDLDAAEAVGEVLVAPFDIDGRFVCPALRERVIAFDARRLGRLPGRDRRRLGREQGPADPRRAAGGRRPDARHRRRDRRGRRRARRGNADAAPPAARR